MKVIIVGNGIAGMNPGALNHDFVVRNAADTVNTDLSVQFNDVPSSFDEILTGGNTLRRATGSQHARAAGVPIQVDDLLDHGKIVASNVADEVNGDEPTSSQKGVETIVAHPEGSHQNQTLKEGVSGMVAFLIGESADNAHAEMAGTLPDDDGEDDDLETEDDDINVDEEGSELPDDFDADDFLASLEDESDD